MLHLKGFNCHGNTSQSTAKRTPELPPTLEMDAQSSPREPRMELEEPHGSPKRHKGIPRGCQRRSKVALSGPKSLRIPPKMRPKRCYFRDWLNMRILKDVPYGINDFGRPGPLESDPRSTQNRGSYTSGLRSSCGGAQEQPEGIHGDPGGSWRAL